ncbi:hydrolase [Haloarchaeobius amylolyticus]|uniref:hydrolase n=1 Tax=Haloarchaeobius amylolyticus TaxID=1198296 RepID=UPI00227179AC|nr:hydrolase [Haloarchaeobius amylolyticus]
MPSQWEGGTVVTARDTEPPVVDEWAPVSVPGRPARFAGEDAVAYRLQFSDPRAARDQRTLLDFRGVYGRARFWLDGELLGEHDTYFDPARFEFEPGPENELIVECHRPTDGFGGVYETDMVPGELAVPGVWWGAHLRLRPPAFVTDLVVNPRLTDDGAVIDTAVCVDAAEPVDESVTLTLRPEGFRGGGTMERVQVDADAGERVTVTRTLELHDPSYWWPQGYGDQHRYTVRAKFRDHERTRTTGICPVRYEGGLWANGQRVQARGVNLLPSDSPRADLAAAAEAGFNLVRVHAHVLPQWFYDAADEAGLLVWQDLPLTGPAAVDPARGQALARTLTGEYDHHPSVAMFGVHDDPVESFPERLGTGRLARLRFRRRVSGTTFDRATADAIASAFPDDATVFPVCGPPGCSPDAAHLYPGWDYGDADTVDWLLAKYPEFGRVVTEFGAGSLTERGARPVGLDRERHDAVVGDDGAGASQATQARIVKRVAEALRIDGADVLAAFCLRDVASGGGMGVVAHDGTPKPAYDALADSFQPVVALCDGTPPGSVDVTVVNDTPDQLDGTFSWTAGEAGESVPVVVAPGAREPVGTVSVPADADTLELVVDGEGRRTVNRYSL